MGPAESYIRSTVPKKWTILKLSIFALLICEVPAWTYHDDKRIMTWDDARKWCQTKYTDMVFIRNKNESNYLINNMPGGSPYFWIGIKKENDIWIWKEMKKPVPEDLKTWATGEPSSGRQELCVELYINRLNDNGKWNNDPCHGLKKPLCYKDSCSNSTCNQHGECVEEIGNYSCECRPGFHGNNCEHAVSCVDLQIPANGKIICTVENGKYQYNAYCNFSCDEGYKLNGTKSVFCQNTGEWSGPAPTCLAVSCVDLQIPANGKINCTDEHGKLQYKSFCNFSCDEGYELNGTKSVFCQNTGEWSEPTPTCSAVSCKDLQIPANGKINCTGKFHYNSFCNISCDEGYELNGTTSVFCQNTGEWSEPIPTCLALNGSLGTQKQITIISSVMGTIGLFMSGIPIAYIISYLRKKQQENSNIIKTKRDPPNTIENPAFEDKDVDSLDI
ncbi:E-selectin-like [Pyxicephalus adspersus]|uniref:E-selectin-like n=1 Tax=Pyxicephalus adspersus TaxID=30357 RepID=UPI003B5AF543